MLNVMAAVSTSLPNRVWTQHRRHRATQAPRPSTSANNVTSVPRGESDGGEPAGERERVRGGDQGDNNGQHNHDRGAGQRSGDSQREEAQEAARSDELLRGEPGGGRPASGDVRDDVQRVRGAVRRQVAVRQVHVRRLELPGRVLLHGLDPPPVLHQRGQVLRDRQPLGVHGDHAAGHRRMHAGQRVAPARPHQLHTDLHGMVHHSGALGLHGEESRGRFTRRAM